MLKSFKIYVYLIEYWLLMAFRYSLSGNRPQAKRISMSEVTSPRWKSAGIQQLGFNTGI